MVGDVEGVRCIAEAEIIFFFFFFFGTNIRTILKYLQLFFIQNMCAVHKTTLNACADKINICYFVVVVVFSTDYDRRVLFSVFISTIMKKKPKLMDAGYNNYLNSTWSENGNFWINIDLKQ